MIAGRTDNDDEGDQLGLKRRVAVFWQSLRELIKALPRGHDFHASPTAHADALRTLVQRAAVQVPGGAAEFRADEGAANCIWQHDSHAQSCVCDGPGVARTSGGEAARLYDPQPSRASAIRGSASAAEIAGRLVCFLRARVDGADRG